MADKGAAKAVSQIMDEYQTTDDCCSLGCEPYCTMYWPIEKRPKENGEKEEYYIENLKHYPLTRATAWELEHYIQLYGKQGAGIYIDSVRKTHKHIHQYYTRQKIESDDLMYRRYCQGAKANWGRLWNKSLAFMYGMPYMKGQAIAKDNYCPLCGLTDSSGHILDWGM